MKRLFAILLVCALLAAPAVAEELYTFAGVPWDTPISECEALLEEGTGAEFTLIDYWDYRIVAIDPGYYSVLGMPIESTESDSAIEVYYDLTEAARNGEVQLEDDAAWALTSISCRGRETPLDAEGLQLIRDVFDNASRKYGEPTMVLLFGGDEHDEYLYIVPQEEYPYIVDDCFAFAQAQGWYGMELALMFRNVCVGFVMEEPWPPYADGQSGVYSMALAYTNCLITEDTLNIGEGALKTFPWVNGEPYYRVIDP